MALQRPENLPAHTPLEAIDKITVMFNYEPNQYKKYQTIKT
jgi:hypothetical protein